jgi:hypothetical protein
VRIFGEEMDAMPAGPSDDAPRLKVT